MAEDTFDELDGWNGSEGRSDPGTDDFGTPNIPEVPVESHRSRRRWTWLLIGVAIGIAGTLVVPELLGPYLPGPLAGERTEIQGDVLRKQMEDDRLLLTVASERGAVLATFREQVSEIDLLVSEGDSVTLAARAFRPFVENPEVLNVRKGRAPAEPSGEGRPTSQGAAGEPAAEGPTTDGETGDTTEGGAEGASGAS